MVLYIEERNKMVAEQIERRGIKDSRVLEAMRTIPRHLYLPEDQQEFAYEDRPLPIGLGQTISQPYIVALMSELLCLHGTERVLEIGTGCGYQSAVLAALAGEVHTLEIQPEMAALAKARLLSLGIENCTVHTGDGSLGWKEAAPYKAILVTAAAPAPSPMLFSQLEDGGRLVIPVGGKGSQDLQLWWKDQGELEHESVLPVAFVPLRGAAGWGENDW